MQRLEILRQKVAALYGANNPDADQWNAWGYPNHVLVVADLAEKIAKDHQANVEFAVAGALLHDIADAVMTRKNPAHEDESLKLAAQVLEEAGFQQDEVTTIVEEILKPHSCNELMPTLLEGKVVASADGAAHFMTDFYPYFSWQHYSPENDYQAFKQWVQRKIEKDFTKKLFFDEVKEQVRPRYEAIKQLWA